MTRFRKEAGLRYAEKHEWSPQTFLFMLDDKTFIDAMHKSNFARWINHRCDPDCNVEDEDKRILIHALRNIRRGDELS